MPLILDRYGLNGLLMRFIDDDKNNNLSGTRGFSDYRYWTYANKQSYCYLCCGFQAKLV